MVKKSILIIALALMTVLLVSCAAHDAAPSETIEAPTASVQTDTAANAPEKPQTSEKPELPPVSDSKLGTGSDQMDADSVVSPVVTNEDEYELMPIETGDTTVLPVFRELYPISGQTVYDDYDTFMAELEADAKRYVEFTGLEISLSCDATMTSELSPKFYCNLDGELKTLNSLPWALTFTTDIPELNENNDGDIFELLESNVYLNAALKYAEITDPAVLCSTSYASMGSSMNVFTVYQDSDSYVNRLVNAGIGKVEILYYTADGNDEVVVMISKRAAFEECGEYQITKFEDAAENVKSAYGLSDDKMNEYDIGYYRDVVSGYMIPCYRILADNAVSPYGGVLEPAVEIE